MLFSTMKRHMEDLRLTVSDAGQVHVSSGWKHQNHIIANNCLYLFREGEGRLEINGSSFIPKRNQLFVLPAGARISYSTSHENPFRLMYCHFHAFIGQLPLFKVIDSPLCIAIGDRGDVFLKSKAVCT